MTGSISYFDSNGYQSISSPTIGDLSAAFDAFNPHKGHSEIHLGRPGDRLIIGIDLTGHFYIVRFWSLNIERSWRERCIHISARAETARDEEIEFDAPNGEGYSFPEKYLLTREEAFELAQHYFLTGEVMPDDRYSMIPFVP